MPKSETREEFYRRAEKAAEKLTWNEWPVDNPVFLYLLSRAGKESPRQSLESQFFRDLLVLTSLRPREAAEGIMAGLAARAARSLSYRIGRAMRWYLATGWAWTLPLLPWLDSMSNPYLFVPWVILSIWSGLYLRLPKLVGLTRYFGPQEVWGIAQARKVFKAKAMLQQSAFYWISGIIGLILVLAITFIPTYCLFVFFIILSLLANGNADFLIPWVNYSPSFLTEFIMLYQFIWSIAVTLTISRKLFQSLAQSIGVFQAPGPRAEDPLGPLVDEFIAWTRQQTTAETEIFSPGAETTKALLPAS
jgi:hypothetical protein